MAELKRKVHRIVLRAVIVLGYCAIWVLVVWSNEPTSADIVNFIREEKILYWSWGASVVVLVYLLDFVIPRATVVWCRISNSVLELYPSGSPLSRWSVPRADIEQIRVVIQGFFKRASVYLFLRSGELKVISDCTKEELAEFVSFIRKAMPEADIRDPRGETRSRS